jgi:hypothetical protein
MVETIRYRVAAHRLSAPSQSAPAAMTIDLWLTNMGQSPVPAYFAGLRLRLASGQSVKPAYWKADPSQLRPGERRKVRVGFALPSGAPSPDAANGWRLEIP